MLENTNNSYVPSGRNCYVCGVDLVQQNKRDNAEQNKKDNSQQNDLNASIQKFPEMTLWNGVRKEELCAPCYKNHVENMKTYKEKHPEYVSPKLRE